MFVLRKTMDAAVEAEREAASTALSRLAHRYGAALESVTALQEQLAAWVLNVPGNITPQQMAQMFYAQDDRWQADFFNSLQTEIESFHASLPPPHAGEFRTHPGVPAGEGQWWHMTKHLTDSGFESLHAMYEHAASHREREAVPGVSLKI